MELFQRSASLLSDNTMDISTILIAVMTILRGMAEIFGVLGRWIGKDKSDTVIAYLGKAIDFLGWVVGLFGIGRPANVSFGSKNNTNQGG